MATMRPVDQDCKEFDKVEYLLDVCSPSTSIDLMINELSAIDHSQSAIAAEFERNNKGLLVLDTWVDVNSLADPDNLESVLKTGFTVSEEGKKFSSGTFRVKSWSDLEQGQSTTHRYLLCKMAVGRAVQSPYSTPPPAGQDGNGGQQRGHILPHGCHSIYVLSDAVDTLSPEQKEPGPEGDEDLMSKLLRTPYRHDYILFHTHQVLPCYVVEFEAKRDDEKKRGTAQAIIANAKEELQSFKDQLNKLDLQQPKRRGGAKQSATVMAMETAALAGFKSVEDDYNTAIDAARKPDSVLDQRLKFLESQRNEVQSRLREVNSNSARVEEAIYSQLQNTLYQLQESAWKKMSILLGEQAEIQRQIEQIQWMDEFKEIAAETLDPAAFVSVWECHQAMRSTLYTQPSMPSMDVQADMELLGSVTVRCSSSDSGPPKVTTMQNAPPPPMFTQPAAVTSSPLGMMQHQSQYHGGAGTDLSHMGQQPPASHAGNPYFHPTQVPVVSDPYSVPYSTRVPSTPVTSAPMGYAQAPSSATTSVALQGVQDDIQQMWADVLAQKEPAYTSQPAPSSSLSDVMKDLEDTLKRTGASSSKVRV